MGASVKSRPFPDNHVRGRGGPPQSVMRQLAVCCHVVRHSHLSDAHLFSRRETDSLDQLIAASRVEPFSVAAFDPGCDHPLGPLDELDVTPQHYGLLQKV